jgi:hypothetical protein
MVKKMIRLKIKSRQNSGGLYNKILIKNYFEAGAAWIANLGVVPLFLLAAFLLAPMFFFFLSLLFVVTHVLETIRQLLFRYRSNKPHYLNFKPSFLPVKSLCVKKFLCLNRGKFLIVCTILSVNPVYATVKSHNLVLARGQSSEIAVPGLTKFNIGNREVVTYSYNEKNNKMLIRGARIGHSELLVWNKDHSVESFQIFVVSKNQESKFLHLAEMATGLGLDSEILIPNIRFFGTLKNLKQYLDYKKIQEQNKELIMDEVTIETVLMNKIIAEVYSSFFDEYKENVKCKAEFSEIICSYPENESPSESVKKFLGDKFKVTLIQKNNQQLKKNYHLKLKLIQLEQMDGEDLRLGLEQMSGSLADFMTLPLEKIIQKNQVLLAQKKVRMNTLAEPQTLLRALTPADVQIGADIPFKSVNSNNVSSTDWRFAGLKIHILLENMGDQLKLNFETELTQPTTDTAGLTSIGGNKEKSSVVLDLKKPTRIFQISLKTEGKSTDQMPFLNAIPLLGELFKSKSNQSNYKTITGIIEVDENE